MADERMKDDPSNYGQRDDPAYNQREREQEAEWERARTDPDSWAWSIGYPEIPDFPDFEPDDSRPSEVESFSLSVQSNTISHDQPVPVVLGSCKVKGHIVWMGEHDESTARLIIVLCQGLVSAIREIQINGLEYTSDNFPNTAITAYLGTGSQVEDEAITGAYTGSAVGGLALRYYAYLACKLEASSNLSGTAIVSCVVDGELVETYDSSTGLWSGASHSENPAALIRHVLKNVRWGLRKGIEEIDDDSFAVAYDYFNEPVDNGEGGTEPRFRLNYVMNTKRPARTHLINMLAVCRSSLIFEGRRIRIQTNKPVTPVHRFGDGSDSDTDNLDNMYKDSFSWNLGSIDDVPNRIVVYYTEKDQNYSVIPIIREDRIDQEDRGYVLEKKVSLIGIHYQSQAQREAKYFEAALRYNSIKCTWTGFLDARHVRVGDVVSITAKSALYANRLFRITEIQLGELGRIRFNGCEYNASIYDDRLAGTVISMPQPTGPNVFAPLSNVTNLTLAEFGYEQGRSGGAGDGKHIANIDVSWTAISDSETVRLKHYRVEYSDDDGVTYKTSGLATNTATSYRIPDLRVGITYVVRVRTVSENNIASSGATETLELVGKNNAPNDVADFSVNFVGDEILFTWNANTDIDLEGYEIRTGGSTWETSAVVETFIVGTQWRTKSFIRGTHTYFIKAIDYSGNYSENAVSDVITITNVSEDNVVLRHNEFTRLPILLGHDSEGTFNASMGASVSIDYNSTYYRRVLVPRTALTWTGMEALYPKCSDAEGVAKFDQQVLTEATYITEPIELSGSSVYGKILLAYKTASEGGGTSFAVDFASSTDGITYTPWKALVSAELITRFIKFRIRIQTTNATYYIRVTDFEAIFDVPDITDQGKDVAVVAAGTTITFNVGFSIAPKTVVVTTVDAVSNIIPVVSTVTRVTFRVFLYDKTDAAVAGNINWFAKGAGGIVS